MLAEWQSTRESLLYGISKYKGKEEHSGPPDRNFCCFYPCKIILYHIPETARGKDKNEKPHVSHTSIRDFILTLKWRHHIAFQRNLGFSGSLFNVFFQYEMRYLVVSKKKNPLFVWGWDRKICPSRSPFVITWQASWCQSVILGTDFSIPPSHSW